MTSNYGYKPSNARTFNQLVQQGLGAEEAARESGVSVNPAAYGYGTNSNLGSIIPGAGGVVGGAADAPELTRVVYPQSGTEAGPTTCTNKHTRCRIWIWLWYRHQ